VDPKKVDRERKARTGELLKAVVMSPNEKLYDIEPKEPDADERALFIAAV
jgi:hypothetical protein